MKKIITIAIIALFSGIAANAETNPETNPGGTAAHKSSITIKTTKATKTLVETWANKYMQLHNDIDICVTSKQSATADITYILNNNGAQENVTLVGRYAILPITSTSNPIIGELEQKEWSKSDLKKLYFSSLDEELDEDDEANRGKAGKLRERLTVYSGANASSSASVFAGFFGYQPSEIRGNKISGDDIYLLNAIDEDKQSITFNTLSYIYDIDSRHLKSNITILPLKTKSAIGQSLQQDNLDATLKALEHETSDLIPVQAFGFTYDKFNSKAQLFLEWVASEGQEYNNQNGFLRLPEEEIKKNHLRVER